MSSTQGWAFEHRVLKHVEPTFKNYTWIKSRAPGAKRIIRLNLATASGRLRLSPFSVSQISSHSPFGACAKSAEVLKVLPWNFCSKIDPKVLNRFWQSKVLILLNLCDICHDSCDFRMLGITESQEVPWQEVAISLSCVLFAAWKIWACHGEGGPLNVGDLSTRPPAWKLLGFGTSKYINIHQTHTRILWHAVTHFLIDVTKNYFLKKNWIHN